jgi:rod shape-determining protein MreD
MDKLPGIRPRESLGRQLDMAARWAFPATSTALLLLAAAMPLGVPGQPVLQISVAIACVFFWSLFRPGAMLPLTVFLIGLLADLLGFAPIGVSVLSLLVVHAFALRWRRVLVRQGFLLVWLAFVGIAAGAAALQWALTAVLTFRLLPFGPAAFQMVVCAGIYPILATPLTRAHHSLAAPERA